MKNASWVLSALLALLTACTATRAPAPVVDRTGPRTSDLPRTAQVPSAQTVSKQAERGYYTVKKGDTLIQISLEFGQNYRDLVAWNNLANPHDIKVDQVLRVMPPEPGQGPVGSTQVGNVATSSGVEVRPLNAPATPTQGAAPTKTAPRGDKRPYSEQALAELQKPDASSSQVAAIKPDLQKQPEAKTPEKAPETPGSVQDEDSMSWVWPAEGKVIGTFSEGRKGIDIAGKSGQPVVAAGPGKVMYASSVRGYGNLVILRHSSSLLSAYAHNKTILVKEGQTVAKGQKIAEMGNSDTDAVKLHFEIRQQGKPVDPSKFLPDR